MTLKTFTIEDIRSWNSCYDRALYLPEGWSGTALEILKHEAIPAKDKLWVVLRESIIDDKTLRLFAVWCCRQVQHLMLDPRSIAAVDVTERFALGEATKEEMDAAWDAAWDAARDIAKNAVRHTDWLAALAASDVTVCQAYLAANETALACSWACIDCDAARDTQVAQLIKMLEEQE